MKVITLAVMMLFAQMIHTGPYRKKIGALVLNPCAVGAWPMDESSGNTFHDITANANTATINGTLNVDYFWQSNIGLPGTTVNWGGTGGYALTTNTTITNFDGTTPFSATAWYAPPDGHAYTMMGTLLTASNFKGWSFETKAQGVTPPFVITLDFFLINSYPSNAIDVQASVGGTGVSPATGPPTYFVATYDGSRTDAGVKLYANGVPLTTATNVNTLTSSTANSNPIRFASRDNGTNSLTGAMAFAEVYNCVLTPTQVATYYAGGPGLY